MRRHHIAPLALTLLLSTSCDADSTPADDEQLEEVGFTAQGIYNGSAANNAEQRAVVSLNTRYSDGSVSASIFCSGTLITSTVVVTAAHCLDIAHNGASTFKTRAPSSLAIYVGNQPSSGQGAVYAVSETVIHPSYNRVALRNDIALVRLSSPVPSTSAVPIPHLPASLGFSSSDVGHPITFVGFGTTQTGSIGTKLQIALPLGGLGCTVGGCGNSGDAATQISYSQAAGAGGPCSGDSGGPALIQRGSQWYVGATTSYGDAGCTVYGVSNRTDAFQGWIDQFIGGGGSTGPACGNGTCEAGESCDGRAGTTSCISDCPGKLGGKPASRFCQVGATCEGPGCP